MTRKEHQRPPGMGDGNCQGNVPTVLTIATENTHINLVELPLNLFVFVDPKLN
jgi:hypothetical protein